MFVTLEGPEGAGKTTVAEALSDRLVAAGHRTVLTREPGAGPVGRAIRAILLHGEVLDARAELFLFLADRAQHVATTIRPALDRGETVLCDRYADSTVVYQGYGRGLDVEMLRRLNDEATGGLKPDLTILLDLPVEVGLARLTDPDRLDREPRAFHQAVRHGFLALAAREPARWRVVDASLPLGDVVSAAWDAVAAAR